MSSFRLAGIDPAPFAHLFELPDARLRASGAVRMVADRDFGFPCRVGLDDARAGDELLLLPYEHLPGHSPYRASGPIFVRRGASRRVLAPGEVPPYVTRRLVSVRAYDADDMMLEASVCEGHAVGALVMEYFARRQVRYIHLHNAKRGCFSCRVDRA